MVFSNQVIILSVVLIVSVLYSFLSINNTLKNEFQKRIMRMERMVENEALKQLFKEHGIEEQLKHVDPNQLQEMFQKADELANKINRNKNFKMEDLKKALDRKDGMEYIEKFVDENIPKKEVDEIKKASQTEIDKILNDRELVMSDFLLKRTAAEVNMDIEKYRHLREIDKSLKVFEAKLDMETDEEYVTGKREGTNFNKNSHIFCVASPDEVVEILGEIADDVNYILETEDIRYDIGQAAHSSSPNKQLRERLLGRLYEREKKRYFLEKEANRIVDLASLLNISYDCALADGDPDTLRMVVSNMLSNIAFAKDSEFFTKYGICGICILLRTIVEEIKSGKN